jgi:cyclopropane fatty-acyl-phospholipid synthase-like methyltransferase
MLFDDEEIRIMSTAKQSLLRNPNYSITHSENIFTDFFGTHGFAGTKMLELGPGQFDFARMVEAAGGRVVSIDSDPAVAALGRKRGYDIIEADYRAIDWRPWRGTFDGLFARASINAFHFLEPEPLIAFVDAICSTLKPGGWGWLAPWNGDPTNPARPHVELMLETQRRTFERHGFTSHEPAPAVASHYQISQCENCILFMKNINADRLMHWRQ